ncbi:MAG: VanW family protein [Clostridia bacterium]|nr:VanW family protein [Clostridia bacterium]
MDNNKNDMTHSDSIKTEKENEVVFAGNAKVSSEKNTDDNTVTFASVSSKSNNKTTNPSESKTADERTQVFRISDKKPDTNNVANDGVVFASVDKKTPKHAAPRQKKKFPVVPVAITAAVVLCVGAVGTVLALNMNKDTVPAETPESSHLTVPSATDESSNKSESSLTSIPQESAEIKEVDTKDILFGKGVTVEGIDLTGKSLSDSYEVMKDTLANIRDNINISISCDGKSLTLTQDDFSFDTNVADVLVQAYHYSRGELDTPTVQTISNNGSTDFKITSIINNSSIKKAVKKTAKQFNVEPVDAHVVSFDPTAVEKFTYADGSNGYLVDQNVLESKITDILSKDIKTGSFSIETTETPYKVTLAEIKANTKLIASHSTTANNVWASNHNMELAIKTASGTEVKPGEVFSFNGMTGDTTNGLLGYVPSTAIVGGRYEQQYGGGICQASTTIYICALKADMEVVERHAHQYPSSYAERGLDATVDYGNLDMQFKNSGKYSIYIATYVYDYNGDGCNELMVEMYGSPFKDFDEVVPVGWVDSVGSSSFSAKGAKVYFKNGKEIKREYLPVGSYDYKYDTYYSAQAMMPSDPSFGPVDVSPTMKTPTVYSPGGNGSNAPVPYGTGGSVVNNAENTTSNTTDTSGSGQ